MKTHSIIITYNGATWIERCLYSLIGQDLDNHKIIVIDNDSSDETTHIIKKQFPQVTLIETGENLGFGKANNIGLRIALKEQADFVFLLNQDAWILNNGLSKLLSIASDHEEYGILAPLQITKNGELDRTFKIYLHGSKTPGLLMDRENNLLKEVYQTEFANAGAWLISEKCLKHIGGFNPLFDHYGEDKNYIHRCRHHNIKIGITPKIEVVHDRPQQKKIHQTVTALSRNIYTFLLIELINPNTNRTIQISNSITLILKTLILYHNFKVLIALIVALRRIRHIGMDINEAKKMQLSFNSCFINNTIE
ncbi:MAG: glycosyltransferase family 2 protein [Bacteroidia bacterium]|nr:glycosyltransferase family 2 protein [Bacteroidia bacterium]